MQIAENVSKQERAPESAAHAAEVAHWSDVEDRVASGERLFWLNHPRVAYHYYTKAQIDGHQWREWILGQFGGPGKCLLELGCGDGTALSDSLRMGLAEEGYGIDLDRSRFTAEPPANFIAADLNAIQFDRDRYDVIYALQSFHHFEALEHIMEQVSLALTDRGFFVLDEFVGPARFQWTDLQLSLTGQLLGLMPKHLRMYANGAEKLVEGRSTPQQVIDVCPSEAIRSSEIVSLFYKYFDVVHHRDLGGTIQHLLYSGIVQNFPDDDPAVDHMIDCIDGIESSMIEQKMFPSDFVLLVGRRKRS